MSWQSPNNNCRVRLRSLLRWKNALNHDYKIDNGHNFQFTKFSFIDFVLTDRRRLSGKQPKSASGKSSSCRFLFSAERNANTKVTEYVTFGFFFNIGFLPLLEKFVLESTVDGIFLSFVPLIQTLQIYSNDSDPVAITLITEIKSKKFVGAVYLLHEVLPILSHLSRAFQKGNISLSVIAPAVEFILEELKSVAEKQSPLEC